MSKPEGKASETGSEPLSVLMTADTVGGVFTYALDLSSGLCANGVRVHLATMGAPLSADQKAALEAIENLSFYESDFRLEWMEDPWDDLERAGGWLLELAAAVKPDIVHLNSYVHAALPWKAPVVVVAHSCVYSWFQAVKGGDPPPSWERYRAAVAAGLHAAERVVAPTRVMLESLERNYGRLSRTQVIMNGRRGTAFRNLPKEDYLFAAGRLWDEAKNVAVLNDVAPLLPWPVYAAGDGAVPGGPDDRSSGGTAGRFSGVTFLGRLDREQMIERLARTPVFVHPAKYEPFGLSPLEAAFSGAALVLGDIPSLREVWGDAALYVPPGDAGAIAAVLLPLIEDGTGRRILAEKAGRRAARYSLERMTAAYRELYAELRGTPFAEAKTASAESGNLTDEEGI